MIVTNLIYPVLTYPVASSPPSLYQRACEPSPLGSVSTDLTPPPAPPALPRSRSSSSIRLKCCGCLEFGAWVFHPFFAYCFGRDELPELGNSGLNLDPQQAGKRSGGMWRIPGRFWPSARAKFRKEYGCEGARLGQKFGLPRLEFKEFGLKKRALWSIEPKLQRNEEWNCFSSIFVFLIMAEPPNSSK